MGGIVVPTNVIDVLGRAIGIPAVAGGAITPGDLVSSTDGKTFTRVSADKVSDALVGIAQYDPTESGDYEQYDDLTVFIAGPVVVVADEAINEGELIMAGGVTNNGRAKQFAPDTTSAVTLAADLPACIGRALVAAAAQGDKFVIWLGGH